MVSSSRMEDAMDRRSSAELGTFVLALVIASALAFTFEKTLLGFNYVIDANGTYWGIQDNESPYVDTGSIRASQIAPGGQTSGEIAAYSTALSGFGGIRVLVQTTPTSYLNGEVIRGFGLTLTDGNRFNTTQSLDLGGVTISRSVYINTGANWGRWLDTFTNTTVNPLTIKVAFGGQSGAGVSGVNSSQITTTSSGDAIVSSADSWVEYGTALSGSTIVGGPQVTVIGSPSPHPGAMTFAGTWLYDSFNSPLVYSGHERNFQAYVNTLTLAPGKSSSLLHFIVLGTRVNTSNNAAQRADVEAAANSLASAPVVNDLTTEEVCSITNFNVAALTSNGFGYSACASATGVVAQAPAPPPPSRNTSVRYDVGEKTIGQLQADMEAGVVTSREITKAYLDRIAAYDVGQLGFHAYEIVAGDAMGQANAADRARRNGAHGALLGIPIALKNLYDTKDMATTNGSFTFRNFHPAKDAFQVARLRAAGAVIIGKAALEEYATSGHWSNDAYGQVWQVFKPSNSPLASSGGPGTVVAGSLAAAAMGSQTGDSLYAPSSAQSLVTLRGTDGLESGTGVQPLTWLTDFGGAMTRSVPDLADVLTVVVGEDPDDPATSKIDHTKIPSDWRTALDVNALQGKRIGYVDSAWYDAFQNPAVPSPLPAPGAPWAGDNGTILAMKSALQYLTAAGATLVRMGALADPSTCAGASPCPDAPVAPAQPIPSARIVAEGWRQYIDNHPELVTQGFSIFTEVDVSCSQVKVLYVRVNPANCATVQPRLTASEIQQQRDYRQITRPAATKKWMDDANVDAVIYPGLLSDISVNDGGGSSGKVAFGRRDTPSATNGVPSLAFPAGMNDHGQPVNIQFMGRAWDDAKLVGFAFAFEHYATLAGNGHQVQTTAPALRHGQ
jgi:amidase